MYIVVDNFRHNKKKFEKGQEVEKCEDLDFLVSKGLLKKKESKKPEAKKPEPKKGK